MQVDENTTAPEAIVYITHDGYIEARVVPSQEDRIVIALMTVGS